MEVVEHSPWGSLVLAGISTVALTASAIAMVTSASAGRRSERPAVNTVTVSTAENAGGGVPSQSGSGGGVGAMGSVAAPHWQPVEVYALRRGVDASPVAAD